MINCSIYVFFNNLTLETSEELEEGRRKKSKLLPMTRLFEKQVLRSGLLLLQINDGCCVRKSLKVTHESGSTIKIFKLSHVTQSFRLNFSCCVMTISAKKCQFVEP